MKRKMAAMTLFSALAIIPVTSHAHPGGHGFGGGHGWGGGFHRDHGWGGGWGRDIFIGSMLGAGLGYGGWGWGGYGYPYGGYGYPVPVYGGYGGYTTYQPPTYINNCGYDAYGRMICGQSFIP